jgi:cobalt/nickel transport system permease protein
MTISFDPPPCPDSPLRRLDARWKLAGLLIAAAAVAALRTLPPILVALAFALLLAVIGRLPRRWYLQRVATVAIFLALFTLPLPFLMDGAGPTWTLGPVSVSWHGISAALVIAGKALTMLTLMLVLLTAAPLEETLKAAHALHVPGVLIQVAILTYRYVFVLSGELSRVRVALRVRGYRNRATRHSYRTIGHIAGGLLVRGYERAERVGHAMRCRGFDGQFRSLTEFRTTIRDVFAFVVLLGIVGALVAWDLWQSY